MICDSVEQRAFIQDAVRKYPTDYQTALQLANTFGQSIQDAQIIPLKDQPKAKPGAAPLAPPAQPNPVEGNGNVKLKKGKTRKATK
jgi:hypothetical protein